MSSTFKTPHLKLNKWEGCDIPERLDFVGDNEKIDKEIYDHTSDDTIHVSPEERYAWNNFYYTFTYIGDGSSSRTVESGCPFIPSWGLIFASSTPLSIVDFDNESNYNYFGIFSNSGNIPGLTLSGGKNLKVNQSAVAVQKTEYRNYNQNGLIYCVIMFR